MTLQPFILCVRGTVAHFTRTHELHSLCLYIEYDTTMPYMKTSEITLAAVYRLLTHGVYLMKAHV